MAKTTGQTKQSRMDGLIAELREKKAELLLCGGQKRVDKQHAAGKLTARERVDALVDADTFQERNAFAKHRSTHFGMDKKSYPAEGVVTGSAAIDDRLVHIASQDGTVAGGAAGEVHSDKIVDMMKASLTTGSPFIFINDSGGARIQEGINSLAAYGRVFYHNTVLSGVVPQISIICGPCAGGAVYSPALTDFIIQTRAARMFITGPKVIKQVTGEDITAEALGGPEAHMHHSGVIHFIAEDDRDAMRICKKLLSYLPSNNLEDPPTLPVEPYIKDDPALGDIIPEGARQPYNVRDIITKVVDDGDFFEVHEHFAENMIVGFARILGSTIGIVANNPMSKAGVLDIDCSDKGARFIRFCNAFNIPIVTFVDVPGFLPGVEQEYGGIIRHGAKLLFAYSACSVPKVTIVLRKAYGGAYVAMSSKDLGADCVACWPSAEIAVMGAEGAVEIVFRKDVDAAEDPQAKRRELIEQYRATFSTPYVAANMRMVDDIIEPAETRRYLAVSLETLRTKRVSRPEKKHGLMPL
ncbi:MAG: methylmalonyl-CoA carboxyltransferase [Phycisphaerales bacterium]|nr:methylmalonyl-CoA carboxyltransferase [Phycisphaerales bacterium]